MSLHGAPTTLDAIAPTGTAYHSADSLRKIFLPAPGTSGYDAINSKINNYVNSRNTVFGHPCTRYDNPNYGDSSVCADTELGPIAQSLPVTSAVRKGFLIRTCTELVSRNLAVETALSRAGLNVNSTVSFENVRMLYTFMYHGRIPTNAAINALVNVGTAASAMSGHDKWRFILLPLCEANNGEIL